MAYTTINKSTDYFNTKLYTGNGSSNAQTGVGFQPDWVWLKRRDGNAGHRLVDSVRGTEKKISSDSNNAESTETGLVTSFDSDGFTLNSSDVAFNGNGNTYVAWNWKANGAGSSNTDGSIASTVSVDTTAGFSIVKYVGTGSGSNSTVGHGLGVKPAMILVKNLGSAGNWVIWNKNFSSETNDFIRLDETTAKSTTTDYWNNAAPTNQVFGVSPGGYNNNKNGENIIAYCFAEKTGYSKFGSYVGNGTTDGTFIYTGFKPVWIMGKRTDDTNNWYMFDSTRNTFNVTDKKLRADTNAAENVDAAKTIDIVSNGFKIKSNDGEFNASNGTYIYMAFGQSLVGNNNVPATAR